MRVSCGLSLLLKVIVCSGCEGKGHSTEEVLGVEWSQLKWEENLEGLLLGWVSDWPMVNISKLISDFSAIVI